MLNQSRFQWSKRWWQWLHQLKHMQIKAILGTGIVESGRTIVITYTTWPLLIEWCHGLLRWPFSVSLCSLLCISGSSVTYFTCCIIRCVMCHEFLLLIMAALCNSGAIILLPSPLYCCPVVSIFYLLLSFFSSHNLSGRRLDVYHTSTHGVALVRI